MRAKRVALANGVSYEGAHIVPALEDDVARRRHRRCQHLRDGPEQVAARRGDLVTQLRSDRRTDALVVDARGSSSPVVVALLLLVVIVIVAALARRGSSGGARELV